MDIRPEIKRWIVKRYQPLYKRKLRDNEIEEIAKNLCNFVESYSKLMWSIKYGKQR